MFVHQKQGLFLSEYVDDIKTAAEKQNMAPMWKKLMKIVDLDEPTSFVDHVYLGCTQRECKPNEKIFDEYRNMFESRISAGATESIPICQKQKNGIESIFVDKEAILPHNLRLPAASGKIGVVGSIGLIQARHPYSDKGRRYIHIFQVFRAEDTYTHAHVLEAATPLRETEGVT